MVYMVYGWIGINLKCTLKQRDLLKKRT